jgi:hypothetical protein
MDTESSAARTRQRLAPDLLADIGQALFEDPITRLLDRNSRRVEVRDGEVFVDGHVPTMLDRLRVGEVIEAVPGIIVLHNKLVTDIELTIAVSGALAQDAHTTLYPIRVGAYYGWINLAGEAPRGVGDAAEEVAGKVPRVRGVLELPRATDDGLTRLARRPIQPLLGSDVYTSDGLDGDYSQVSQVVILPRNRLVSHIAVQTRVQVKWRTVRGQFVVAAAAIELVSDGGVFLSDTSQALAERPQFREDDFPPAPADWVPPFPYLPGTLRWQRG